LVRGGFAQGHYEVKSQCGPIHEEKHRGRPRVWSESEKGEGPSPHRKKTGEATAISASYKTQHLEVVRKEVKDREDSVRMKRGRTANAEVATENGKLIPNTGFPKSKESKDTKTVDLYWHIQKQNASGIDSKYLEEDVVLHRLD